MSSATEVHWDLTDLYAGMDDPAISTDLDRAADLAEQLATRYHGEIARLDAARMREALEGYESIQGLVARVGAYAYLMWSTDTEDSARGALLQRVTEAGSRIEQKVLFLEIEWAALEQEHVEGLLADPLLEGYRHWLEVQRLYKPYLLSEPEEKILAEKAVTGRQAWTRLFDEAHSARRYELDGKEVVQQQVLHNLHNEDRKVRKRAARSLTAGLSELSKITTYVFNTVLADKASDDRMRTYPSWITARNLANQTDDRTTDALIDAVTGRYSTVARYYSIKRVLLGYDTLYDYDRYAPLPASDTRYDWSEARRIVLDAYAAFHPKMAEIAGEFFDRQWIDAAVTPGKSGGAYSHPVSASAHPYIFMNYQGSARDVMTLAHELGHGVHQYLARKQGELQADTPLTTAETASVFGEMLVFRSLLDSTRDKRDRLALLMGKIEDSFATVFRQIAMNRFEDTIHTARRDEGELTVDRLSELWHDTQKAMFADSVELTDDYRIWWSYIPHFMHTPGYVYAYAFGELLVLALYARYLKDSDGTFAHKYLDMLALGGSRWPRDLASLLGVDLQEAGFWDTGLSILDDMVAQAAAMADDSGAE